MFKSKFSRNKQQQKNGINVVEPYRGTFYAKFEVDISFLCQKYSPNTSFRLNTYSPDNVIFSYINFEHFWTSHSNKNDIFEIPRSYWFRNTHILFENIDSKIWPYVTRGLTWPFTVVDLHVVRLQNGFEFWILRPKVTIKTCAACPKKIFWNWWTFVTFLAFRGLTTLARTKYGTYAHRVFSHT